MSEFLIQEKTLKSAADLLRKKFGANIPMKPAEMVEKIGSLSIVEKDINLYDLDGTLLYSYTFDEIKEIESLPNPPEHDHLIFVEWNWSLDALKSATSFKNVGAIYKTATGATMLFIEIEDENNNVIPLHFIQYKANSLVIDWGDGTSITNIATTGEQYIEHTYASAGSYIISMYTKDNSNYLIGNYSIATGVFGNRLLDLANFPNATYICGAYATLRKVYYGDAVIQTTSRCFDYYGSLEEVSLPPTLKYIVGVSFYNTKDLKHVNVPKNCKFNGTENFSGASSLSICCTGENTGELPHSLFDYAYGLKSMALPENATTIAPYVFKMCHSLRKVNIPDSVTSIQEQAFHTTKMKKIDLPANLEFIGYMAFCDSSINKAIMPDTVTQLGENCFRSCNNLVEIKISKGLTTLPFECFSFCHALTSIEIPNNITTIGNRILTGCTGLKVCDCSSFTSVPTIGTNVFLDTHPDLIIKVPIALLDEWKSATNWAEYADQIIGI